MSTDARRRGMFARSRRIFAAGSRYDVFNQPTPSPAWERASRIAAVAMIGLGWVCLWLAVTQSWPL